MATASRPAAPHVRAFMIWNPPRVRRGCYYRRTRRSRRGTIPIKICTIPSIAVSSDFSRAVSDAEEGCTPGTLGDAGVYGAGTRSESGRTAARSGPTRGAPPHPGNGEPSPRHRDVESRGAALLRSGDVARLRLQ